MAALEAYKLCMITFSILIIESIGDEDILIISHDGPSKIVDNGNSNLHERCSIDFFHHNESYTKTDIINNQKYIYSPNDAYFFLSWSTKNDLNNYEIVGNIYNVGNPYLPIGNDNISYLDITPYKGDTDGLNRNYHFISTSEFKSKKDDIVFSFYNERDIEIHVFGSTKSKFKDNVFLWSPKIPTIDGNNVNAIHSGNLNTSRDYQVIHQNIQCIDGKNEEFIIFVYEEKYTMENGTQFTNIFKSTFDNNYVVNHDRTPINTIKGIISHPIVLQSLQSTNIIITYIVNWQRIMSKLYLINDENQLIPFDIESVIVSIGNDGYIKYYNIIPLSIGGYIVMYCVNDMIYIVLLDDNGVYHDHEQQDIFIDKETNNTLNHGQIIELQHDDDDDDDDILSKTETFILITFVAQNDNDDNPKLYGKVYYLNFNTNEVIWKQQGNVIEMKSFSNYVEDGFVIPNYQCISYDNSSNMIVIGWINNHRQVEYKPFTFHPFSIQDQQTQNGIIIKTTITPNITETTLEVMVNTTKSDNMGSDDNDIKQLSEKNVDHGLSSDMEIVIIVLCTAGFYCFIVLIITCIIVYMVNTGKLRFAIGYKQIHQQKNNKKGNKNDDDEDLELGDEDKSGMLADDEQTDVVDVDNDEDDDNYGYAGAPSKTKRLSSILTKKKNNNNNNNNNNVEMHKLVDQSD